MNKILKSILIFFILFLNLTIVKADETADTTTCEYSDLGLVVNFDEGGTGHINQTVYEEHQTPVVLNWFLTKSTGQVSIVNELEHIDKELYGSCPETIYACTLEREEWGNLGHEVIWDKDSALIYSNQKKVYLFYSENNMKNNSDLKDLPNKELVESSALGDNYNVGYDNCDGGIHGFFCGLGTAIGLGVWDATVSSLEISYKAYKSCDYVKYTGNGPTYNLACPNLKIYLGKFNDAISEYKKCSDSDAVCKSKTITNVNEKEDLIKNYCKAILSNYNFDKGSDEEGNEQVCLEACLDIGIQTKKAKVAVGLISGDSGECGLSARLLVWLSNILRWIKYILPVIVIVLGIIDFIKAIATGKDDELKKAQGSFIKRLVSAALVFIIPLIIEFILSKMGFGYDTCGLF